ncbi:MAG TPA: hypothetical protein VM368_05875, partial [Flavisolibacter sp.]|nr:hypothetical protein [Flavisolibacter sp.]
YIYNNNFSLFKKLLENSRKDYHYYVIIPHFIDDNENVHEVINTLPKEKLILVDKLPAGITGNFGAVYENFEKDIYNALKDALPQLEKYMALNIIFPQYSYHPKEILTGFYKFCQEYAFDYKVISNLKKEELNKGEVYINLMEDDLVILLEKVLENNYKIGEDVGVISYNETPVKKFILNGITTISTDFEMIGEKTAELILNKSVEHVQARFHLKLRASL